MTLSVSWSSDLPSVKSGHGLEVRWFLALMLHDSLTLCVRNQASIHQRRKKMDPCFHFFGHTHKSWQREDSTPEGPYRLCDTSLSERDKYPLPQPGPRGQNLLLLAPPSPAQPSPLRASCSNLHRHSDGVLPKTPRHSVPTSKTPTLPCWSGPASLPSSSARSLTTLPSSLFSHLTLCLHIAGT